MATLASSFFDLNDLYKSTDKAGNITPVIEMLMQMSPILDDALAVECNQGTSHMHTIRTGLPTVTWGKLYQGVPYSKSGKTQVTDTTGFVEGLSGVDSRLLKLSKNPGAVRLGEAKSFLEAMNQEVSTKIFYGDTASDPEEFMGLSPRFNDLAAPNANQIVDAGGTSTDNTSIWFITWGDEQTCLLYPEGTSAGITRDDKGEQKVFDATGNPYWAQEEMFTWHVGLAVKDWRYVARIANIPVSSFSNYSVNLFTFMRKAYWSLQGRRVAGGKQAIYCNSDVLEALDALSSNAGTTDNFARLKPTEIEGKEVLAYRGVPLRETDALLNTEARVV